MIRAITNPVGERIESLQENPAELVAARLRRSGYPFLRHVKCETHDGVTVLSGEVPTFHLKQLAQELAAHTRGVQRIENRLIVTSLVQRFGHSAAG